MGLIEYITIYMDYIITQPDIITFPLFSVCTKKHNQGNPLSE